MAVGGNVSAGCWGCTAGACSWSLENPGLVLTVLLLTIALNVAIVIKIPKGFFPQQDTGRLAGAMRGPQDASFPEMNASLLEATRRQARSGGQNVIGDGPPGGGATNTGNCSSS